MKSSVKIGEHTIRLWVIATLLISVICVGVLADYVWKNRELSNLTRIKSVIKVEAEGDVLHYQNENFWTEDQFSKILDDQAQFASNITNQLNETLLIHGERNEYAVDAEVEFNLTRKSTVLKCDIHGAMISSDYYTFRWLLDPSGLDFINNNFQQSEKELFWEGSINDVPTTITLTFPFSIVHCHAHVWRKS